MTRFLVIAAVLAAAPAVARADDDTPVHVDGGMSELDLGALGVLSRQPSGGTDSSTQVSTTVSLRYQYFLSDVLSVGGEAVLAYDRENSVQSNSAYGAAASATAHVHLGRGAYFRPTIALGGLFGSDNTNISGSVSLSESSKAFLMRFQLPFAYFASDHVVLQAGPELDVQLGSTSSDGSESTGFKTIVGGFAIAVGYAF
jgi:hypothetical protein